jgi:hypothetical protein
MPMERLGLTASVAVLSRWVPAAGASTLRRRLLAKDGYKGSLGKTRKHSASRRAVFTSAFFVPPVRRKPTPGSASRAAPRPARALPQAGVRSSSSAALYALHDADLVRRLRDR